MATIDAAIEGLREKVEDAFEAQTPLQIVGGNSKKFYGYTSKDITKLSSKVLDGVISYEPGELMLQVSAGTKIKDLIGLLAAENQMLAFEPPVFDGQATIGGMVASGLSGSRRPYTGAVRDFVLGLNIIDGKGQLLSFGGQVMKNVAGYDVSRLMVGAMGCLGFITEVSFKVLPMPELEVTQRKAMSRQDAHSLMIALKQRHPLVSASAHFEGHLYLRFSGMEASVKKSVTRFGGENWQNNFWAEIDNLDLFDRSKELWRLSTAPNNPTRIEDSILVDWGGGQRWLQNNPREGLGQNKENAHATRIWRGVELPVLESTDKDETSIFQPLDSVLLNLHKGLKQEFDPRGILNPQKMYRQF